MFIKKMLYFGGIIGVPFAWYNLSLCKRKDIRKLFYNKGANVSTKFKHYPMWDQYVEPFFIQQFSIIFTATHAFIEGMVSDNEDQYSVNIDLDNMHKDIEMEIKKPEE